MSAIATPSPRRGGRVPDHSGIRLPILKRRYVPPAPRGRGRGRTPLGGPPVRFA